jgi:ABC-type multidrug transport system ATPase subunit
MFEAKNLERREGSKILLSSISLSVGPGDATAVLGPSGAGKTLLLRSLGFVDAPTHGSIRLEGSEWSFGRGTPRATAPWPRVVLMFQSGGILGHASLFDNIVFGYRGKANWPEKTETANHLAEQLGLSSSLNQRAAVCSVGQRQRASFIRTIISDAEILLLDEPTASIDPAQTENVADIIIREKGQGRSFFISTHMLGFAKKVCNQFIYLQDGRVLESGTMEKLESYSNPDFRQFVDLSSLR